MSGFGDQEEIQQERDKEAAERERNEADKKKREK